MGRLERVGRAGRCVICNSMDQCFRLYHEDGSVTNHCYKKAGLLGTDSSGTDGCIYKFKRFKDTDIGVCAVYEEMSAYKEHLKQYIEEQKRLKGNNYHYKL